MNQIKQLTSDFESSFNKGKKIADRIIRILIIKKIL